MRCAGLLLRLLIAASLAAQPRLLDDFSDVSAWTTAPSDGVDLALASDGGALRLNFDFHGGAGYAVAHRPLALDLPANWEISFRLRGDAPVNNLEFKLIDPSGQNVWWINRKGFEFPHEWREVRNKKRQIEFAWGPAGGGAMKRVAAVEFAITAGTGGQGTVWIDDLTFTELPPAHPYDRTPVMTVGPGWKALDFLEPREYGGLVLDWEPEAAAARYVVEISDDGARWTTLRQVEGGNGGRDYLYVPETESRFLRVRLPDAKSSAIGLRNIDVKPLDWAPSINAFFEAMAKENPRGSFPRGFSGEQSYWTVVGVDGDTEEGLLNEDGALEAGQGAFSIEPFLWMDGGLVSWADVETAQSLADGYLPIPTVTWQRGDLSLEITAFAAGPPDGSSLWARYRVRNRGGSVQRLRLFLAVRPFQVNPPAQFLNVAGGVSPIHEIAWDGHAAVVNGVRRVIPASAPSSFGATSFDSGEIVEHLRQGRLPAATSVRDPFGYASGVFAWDFEIGKDGEREVAVSVPLHPALTFPTLLSQPPPSPLTGPSPPRPSSPQGRGGRKTGWVGWGFPSPGEGGGVGTGEGLGVRVRKDWHARLDRVDIDLPPAAGALVRTFKTAVAHILINRDGPAIQPGSRAYARTWIRDGSLTSSALLRAGHRDEVRDFLEWFAPYQFASGKVPCCVDARGADPVPENDSHGEFLFLVAEYWRYSRDRATVEKVWPHVEKAVAYIDELRRQRRTEEYRQPEKLKFFGLLPESISHEGYSAHPVHSYWDDFFALLGLKDAVALARALGKTGEAERWAASRDEFHADLYASLDRVISGNGIDYIPGSAELADFDATSTTIAVSPGGELANLPQPALEHTFERYWREFVKRRSAKDWDAYTPYELRAVGTFVRLGWKERAHELLDFFLNDRRPPAWNQWPEVVRRDPRAPGFQGDLPHTWVASDFIRSFLDLFAYERDSDQALVLAAGVPPAWLSRPEGIALRNLGTPWGALSFSLTRHGKGVRYRIAAGPEIPPGGIVLSWPLPGKAAGGTKVVRRLPAVVDLVAASPRARTLTPGPSPAPTPPPSPGEGKSNPCSSVLLSVLVRCIRRRR